MSPTSVIIMPHNNRVDLDATDSMLGEFISLPTPMPKVLQVWTGGDGTPAAMWCDGGRVKPSDFACVWHGVEQYNQDCRGDG